LDLNTILNQKEKLITSKYFEAQEKAESLYGENTVIFIEIGTFYEIYQSDKVGKAEEISQLLNIALTRKNKNIREITESNPYLCGVPSVSIDKHLDKLTNEDQWTIIIVNQEGDKNSISRKISKIISPGTNVDYVKSSDYNFIASIFSEKNKEGIIYSGLSMIDLTTGKVLSFENYGTKNDKNIALDEISNIIKTYNTSEIIFTFSDFEEDEKSKIINNITNNNISYTEKNMSELKKTISISYQNELLTKIFNLNSFLSAIEDLDMERFPNSLIALTILINFIIDHNMNVVQKLKRPIFIKSKEFLYLGNNALEQLNIVSHNKNESLINIVNNGVSAIGKRFITDQLINPLVDKKEIGKRYFLSNFFEDEILRKKIIIELKEMYDIERLWRKIDINTISPQELYNFYISLKNVSNINAILSKEDRLKEISLSYEKELSISKFINEIESLFDLTKLTLFSLNNINSTFIKPGKYKDLDSLSTKLNINYLEIINIANLLNGETEIDISKDPRGLKLKNVTVGYNDSEGFYFEITNRKLELIEDSFIFTAAGSFTTKKLKNSTKIYFKKVEFISNEILANETKLIKLNKEVFKRFIEDISLTSIEEYVYTVSYVEFLINNYTLKSKYAYTEPELIETENNESFIEAKNLRHAIIEKVNSNEIYIPNDIIMGPKKYATNDKFIEDIYKEKEDINGFLLYGLNASGKSSQMKSVGISIILAQAGFYVPAESFRYSLFEKVFTRITGSDNIYKGLSTFSIEMLELKNILNRSNEKTLILGDEIAHGTETISALSIVASAVSELAIKKSFFIFATHLHQLKDIEEVDTLINIENIHLEVEYNEETKLLIYNRKIKSGQGSSLYGLEFAKFMQMDNSFLEKAYSIRSKIAKDLNKHESIVREKRSRYHKDKYVTSCEVCGSKAEEEHHISEQNMANKEGLITHYHKNHKSNLVNLCKSCHDKVHSKKLLIEGYKLTSDGNILIFKEN